MPSGYVKPHAMPPRPATDRPGPGLRFRVWRKAIELDTALAMGADPAQSKELALRARQLADPKKRDELVRSIYRLIAIAERPTEPMHAVFRRSQVEANRSPLLELADRLRGHRSIALRGLAMTSVLLEDGRGPLYPGNGPGTLERAVRAALSALEVKPVRVEPPRERASQSAVTAEAR